MSLIHLLAAGRSFGQVRSEPTRYRMMQGQLIPKFRSKPGTAQAPHWLRQTGRTEGRAQPALGIGREDRENAPRTRRCEINPGAARTLAAGLETKASQEDAARTTAKAQPGDERPQRGGLWGLFSRRRGGRSARNPFGGKPKDPVQTELRLEQIQPVRNDLSDADFELQNPLGRNPPMPDSRAEQPVRTSRSWWRRWWRWRWR